MCLRLEAPRARGKSRAPGGGTRSRSALPLLLQAILEGAELLAQGRDLVAQGIRFGGLASLLGLGIGRRAVQPPRARRPLAHDAVGLALAAHDPLETRLERALDEVLPGLAVLDELVEERGRQRRSMVALVLEN